MKRRMRAVACRDLPELNVWRDQPYVKETLLRETGGGDAFVALATQTLRQSLLPFRPSPPGVKANRLSRLLARGYTMGQIARAFAEAWLHDDETFYLPRLRLVDSNWVRHGIPILAGLATVGVFAFHWSHPYPNIFAALIFLSSFLAIPAVLVISVYGWLWRALLGWFTMAGYGVLCWAGSQMRLIHWPRVRCSHPRIFIQWR